MADMQLIPSNWQLPDSIRRRLGRTVGYQRVMLEDDHLLIVAHEVPDPDTTSRKGVLFWKSAEGEWRASNGEPGKAAIEMLLDRYEQRIREFDNDESAAERADQYLRVLEGLSPVSRSMKHFSTVLADARKAVPEASELIDLRDRAYELARMAELNYQDTRNEMDVAVIKRAELQAATSNKMERSAHRLNLMAAFFLPLATLSSIFGTSFTEGWTWSETPFPFMVMLIVGLASGVFLTIGLSTWKNS
ncbi:MAG: CorA family divalent cation transporter [Aureliella sp.]